MNGNPKRWSLYLVNFNPKRGTKPGKIRPCLVVQNESFEIIGSSVILPLTSQVQVDMFPMRININPGNCGLMSSSDIMVDQMTAWDHSKFIKKIGELPEYLIEDTKKALKEFLDLE